MHDRALLTFLQNETFNDILGGLDWTQSDKKVRKVVGEPCTGRLCR